jgi:hypothetical protein
MKRNLFLIISIIVFYNLGCKDPVIQPNINCDSSNTTYIPTDAKSRFFFKEGSWWVYKNTINNTYDTTEISFINNRIATPSKKAFGDKYAHKCYEYIEYHTLSKKFGTNRITIETTMPISEIDKDSERFVYIDDYLPTGSSTISVFRFFYNGDARIDSLSDGIIEKQDSISIGNITYYDVLHYSYKEGFEANDYLLEAWYSNKIGLVKIIRKDGSVWELVDYNTVQ